MHGQEYKNTSLQVNDIGELLRRLKTSEKKYMRQ